MGWLREVFEEHVVRSNNTSINDEDWEVTPGLRSMRTAQTITGAFGLVAGLGSLAYLLTVSCRVPTRNSGQHKMLRIVVGHVVFKTISDVPIFLFSLIDVAKKDWAWCSVFGTLPPLAFVLSCTLTYMIYLERAKATASLTEPSRLSKFLWKVCHFVVMNVPGLLLLMWLSINGKIFYGSVCIQDYGPRLSTVFAFMDTSLSLAFLYLFIEPVQTHLRTMSSIAGRNIEQDSTRQMRLTARRNLVWASITIFVTIVYMITVTIVSSVGTTAENYHLRCLTWVLMPICGNVNLLSTLVITSGVWRPSKSRGNRVNPRQSLPTSRKGSSGVASTQRPSLT